MFVLNRFAILVFFSLFFSVSPAMAQWVDIDKWTNDIDYDNCEYRLKFGALFQGDPDKQSVLYLPATHAGVATSPGFTGPIALLFEIPLNALRANREFLEQLPHPEDSENLKNHFIRRIVGGPSLSDSVEVVQGVRIQKYEFEYRIEYTYSNIDLIDGLFRMNQGSAIARMDATRFGARDNISLQEKCGEIPGLVGDANRDGKVDSADVSIVYSNVQVFNPETDYNYHAISFFNKTWEEGDFDGDGDVDYNDLYRTFIAYLGSYSGQ